MFTDQVKIKLFAGKGGNGIVSWRKEKYIPKGGPYGGDGGVGGSIILEASSQLLSLECYRHKRIIKAENGSQGGSCRCKGKNGKDAILLIPLGTLVKDAKTGKLLYDLTEEGKITLCKGGIGGKGNASFATPTNRAPNHATDGKEGESLEVELELKLIADVGFVGLPNAGKSTLLSKIVRKTNVKIAAYPFTTLFPNLGLLEFDDFSRLLIADIPGIIENAHENKGLGLSFLKHIERTEVLVYVIDISSQEEGVDPLETFKMLQDELKTYDPKMLQKPFLTVLNKTDKAGSLKEVRRFQKQYPYPKEILLCISALEEQGLDEFISIVRKIAQKNTKRFQ
jgi:GTPase